MNRYVLIGSVTFVLLATSNPVITILALTLLVVGTR